MIGVRHLLLVAARCAGSGRPEPAAVEFAARSLGLLIIAAVPGGCARYEPRNLSPRATAAALEARSFADPVLRAFIAANLPDTGPNASAGAWDLDRLTLAGLYFHPDLDLARARWSVAQGGIVTAGARPNPVVSLVPGYDFSAETSGPGAAASPWLPLVNLDVPIETAGKRGHRVAAANRTAEAARLRIAEMAWQVRSAIRTALIGVTYQEARVTALERQESVERQIETTLHERFDAGGISAAEWHRQRVVADRASVETAEARRQAGIARGALAQAIGVPARAIAGLPVALDLLAPPAVDAAREPMRDAALSGRADVLEALADFEASQETLQLEIARQYPDVHLGNGYQYDLGEHKWSVGVTFDLPVLNRNQGPIAEANARREEAAARLLSVQASVLASIDLALTNRALAVFELERARALEEAQKDAVAAAEVGRRAGAIDRLEWLLVQSEQISDHLARLDSASRAWLAVGELEDAMQRPFPGLQSVDHRPGHVEGSP